MVKCFVSAFRDACKIEEVDEKEIEAVLEFLNEDGSLEKGVLQVRGRQFTRAISSALAKSIELADDLMEVDMSECLYSKSDFEMILRGIAFNKSILTLNLRGNQMEGNMVSSLSHLISTNQTISKLMLGWNLVGMEQDSFAGMCQSLELNGHLEHLDMSNNHLSPSCGITLARALAHNGIIKTLDLRSNHFGYQGGTAMLNMLKKNNSISRLLLAGNKIPSETLDAIEMCISHNALMQTTKSEIVAKTRLLTDALQSSKETSGKEIGLMQRSFTELEERSYKIEKDFSFEKGRLEEQIKQLHGEVGVLNGKLSLTKQALVVAEDQVRHLLAREADQTSFIHHLREDFDHHEDNLRKEWSLRKEGYEADIARLESDLLNMKHQRNESTETLEDEKRKSFKLEETLERVQSEMKSKHDKTVRTLQTEFEKEKSEIEAKLLDKLKKSDDECAYLRKQITTERQKWDEQMETFREQEKDERKKIEAFKQSEKDSAEQMLKSEIGCLKERSEQFENLLREKSEEVSKLQLELTKIKSEKDSIEINYNATLEKIKIMDRDKDTITETLKRNFDQKLSKLATIEAENESNKSELAEIKESFEAMKANETDLKQQLQKSEMAIQKMRDEEAAKANQLMMAVKMFIGET